MRRHANVLLLGIVVAFVLAYSLPTLVSKPAYWYDEAINVELAHTFLETGELDVIVAPGMPSGKGATVGSTGYPVTVPLAVFFSLFGFGLEQARAYMLLWMVALLCILFFVAYRLWGKEVAYRSVLLLCTFAPFYGNGRSVMGEIPGFLFSLVSFYFLHQKRFALSGLLLGLAVVSKPSVFVFFIPAFTVALLLQQEPWGRRVARVGIVGIGALGALVPWFLIYADEIARGGLWSNIANHFRNPYAEAGISAAQNIANNLPTLYTSTTLLYMWLLAVGVITAIVWQRDLFQKHRDLFVIALIYAPLTIAQYLKSFGYLRYLVALEFLLLILFSIAFPVLIARAAARFPMLASYAGKLAFGIVGALVVMQSVHLLWFSDLFTSHKTERTMEYLSSKFPDGTIGVINVPQVGSLLPASRTYQYLSTYGLWEFGVRILFLPEERLPRALVTESGEAGLSSTERDLLDASYEPTGWKGGFSVYRLKQ